MIVFCVMFYHLSLVDHFEGVRPISIHVPITMRSASIREQNCHLMDALRNQREKIPGKREKLDVDWGHTKTYLN